MAARVLLEFKIVENRASSKQELLDRYGGSLPRGMMIVTGKKVDNVLLYLVPEHTDLTGKLLQRVSLGRGGQSGTEPIIRVSFNPDGATLFNKLTSENIGRALAIIIDGNVVTAPIIHAPLRNEASIIGNFTEEEAHRLVNLLKEQITL